VSDVPDTFSASYYDYYYFADERGKAFRRPNGTVNHWGYRNPQGEFLGAKEIAEAWKTIFQPKNALDVGCGRGTFVAYMRDLGIEAFGFDFSEWAVGEGRYKRCKSEWLKLHDATKPWPYESQSFDLIVCLDTLEHIYEEDLDFVISEMYRVAKKWVFLQIAVAGTGGLQGRSCTVCSEEWWYERLDHEDWVPRRDMVNWFVALVPNEIISNWLKNSIIVMERV